MFALRIAICMILIFGITPGCEDRSGRNPDHEASVPAEAPALAVPPAPEAQEQQPAVPEDSDTVLARVSGIPVTQHDFNLAARSVVREQDLKKLSKSVRQKILESIVATRAIAQAREAVMSEDELAELEKKVLTYREELLVRQYLAENTPARPVTPEMIQEYYISHPKLSGGETVRMYEMITNNRVPTLRERKALEALLKDPHMREDWEGWAGRLRDRGYPIVFRTGQSDDEGVPAQLRETMQSIGKGEASLIFIKGICFAVRITDVTENIPRPSGKTAALIRDMLGPSQLSKAVREASDQVLEKTEIIYENVPAKP